MIMCWAEYRSRFNWDFTFTKIHSSFINHPNRSAFCFVSDTVRCKYRVNWSHKKQHYIYIMWAIKGCNQILKMYTSSLFSPMTILTYLSCINSPTKLSMSKLWRTKKLIASFTKCISVYHLTLLTTLVHTHSDLWIVIRNCNFWVYLKYLFD